jgi:hypothetical protein
MFNLRKHLSASTLIATAAVVIATSGTAIAAGEIITAPNQIANDVISGGHIKQETISNLDLKDPQLKVRVNKDGTRNGAGDAAVTRTRTGVYEVTFNAGILNGGDGTSTDTVLNENCSINATPHGALRQLFVDGPTPQRPNTVIVNTAGLRNTGGAAGFVAEDNAFDITASC